MRVGVDTFTLSVPVDAADLTGLPDAQRAHIQRYLPDGELETSTAQASATLVCGLQVREQGSHEGRPMRLVVSGSLPKALYGHNVRACDVHEAIAGVEGVVRKELEEVSEGMAWGDAAFSRLDTVTDLRCDREQIGPLLRGLESVPIRKGIVRQLLRSSTDRPETLWARNGSGGARLYDNVLDKTVKGVPASVIERVPEAVRAEAQNMRRWVRDDNCRNLEDVAKWPENIRDLHMRRMKWAGLDREIVSMETWVDRMIEAGRSMDRSDAEIDGAIGYLMRLQVGRPPERSSATLAKYRAIARAAGVHFSDVEVPRDRPVLYRLDFDKGRVVKEAA